MKIKMMNISLMKLIIRLIVVMIFFATLFLLLTILYSSRYWRDIHNYIHANITIKRIPTISELNLTILEVDFTTEYSTDDYMDASTVENIDIDIDELTSSLDKDNKQTIRSKRYVPIEDFDNLEVMRSEKVVTDFFQNILTNKRNRQSNIRSKRNTMASFDANAIRNKRNIDIRKPLLLVRNENIENLENDYSEIPKPNLVADYLFIEDPTTVFEGVIVTKIVKDLIADSKLIPKNYGDVEIIDSLNEIDHQQLSDIENSTDITEVYPWITTIFLKNDSKSNQFEYFCDGALLNRKLLITAARCVNVGNSTADPDSLLVILGKRSLVFMDEKEKIVKVKQIITHENFTNADGKVEHDLALLILENAVDLNDLIQPAVIGNDTQDVDKLITTAWDLQGDVVPVDLDDKENNICNGKDAGKNMFCATYGQDVALCPSYGGIFAAKQESSWYLYGVRSGDTTDRGVCFDKHVWFTDLRSYHDWIIKHF